MTSAMCRYFCGFSCCRHLGEGFTIVVAEISSQVSGESASFEILERPVTEFQEVGGGGGAVGNMNLAMTLVASICGMNG